MGVVLLLLGVLVRGVRSVSDVLLVRGDRAVDGEAAGESEAGGELRGGDKGDGEGKSDSDGYRLLPLFWLLVLFKLRLALLLMFLLIFLDIEAAISASRLRFLVIEARISVSDGFLRLVIADDEVVLRLTLLEKDLGVGVLHLLLL